MPSAYEIFDDEKTLISTLNNNETYEYVKLEDVSDSFKKSLIAIEDKNFYYHNGFDVKRIIKSFSENLFANDIKQGASTISQQVARLIYLTNEKTYKRKLNEAIITKRLEETYSKDYILELYINSTYYAHSIYGLTKASQFYFDKKPSELNYQDSCVLLSIINGPNIYSPFIDYDACLKKVKSIAYTLFNQDIIDVNTYYDILKNKLKLSGNKENIIHPYYIDAIKKELKNKDINLDEKFNIGLKIETNLDINIQSKVENIINNYLLVDDISIIIMKPYSGKVISLIGGKNYKESKFNRALDAYKQIGSTIKPLLYYTALLKGMSTLSTFTSKKTSFIMPDNSVYSPTNSNDIYPNKEINMIEALGMSDNIYAIKTLRSVTIDSFLKTLNLFDIDVNNPNLTLALGNLELSPLKLCSIYNTFASEGIYYKPQFVKKVTTQQDKIKYTSSNSSKSVLDKNTTIKLNYLLQAPFDKALITYSSPTMKNYNVNCDFCVKTGTTDSSSFTVGYNKDFTVLVYVGSDDNSPLTNKTESKKIFKDIVNEITKDSKSDFYEFPSSFTSFKFFNKSYNIYSKTYLK